VPISVVTVME